MILCAGEALIDMLPRVTADNESAFAPIAGGSVFNTAIALARLGVPTGFFSGLSTDLFGKFLLDELAASGVDASLAAMSDRPTTLAFVTLTEGQASYAFYDENSAGRMLTADDLPRLDESVGTLFFGGISLAVEPCAMAYEALFMREAENRVIMLDPNVRASFIRDETIYRERIMRMIARADIVKLSDEDLAWLMDDGDSGDLARNILAMGPAVVFVTEGEKGATGHSAGGSASVRSTSVEVVDSVGAGDTFNAGALAAFHELGVLSKSRLRNLDHKEIEAALTLGTRAAAVTVSRAGANPPTREELG